MKRVFTPPSKFIDSVLDGDLVLLMIPTMRRTTWATLQGLRATGFPVTRGRSLAPTPDSGSTAFRVSTLTGVKGTRVGVLPTYA